MASAAELVFTVFLMIIMTGASTVGNGCVFMAFYRNTHIRTVGSYFFLSLSFGNTIVGLFYPLQCLANVGILRGKSTCLPIACILLFCAMVIAWSTVALTVERYLTIIHPLVAWRILPEKRAVRIIGVILIYAVAAGAIGPAILSVNATAPLVNISSYARTECRFYTLVPSQAYSFFYIANRLLTVPVFIFVYSRIFLVARRHMRAIEVQAAHTQPISPASTAVSNEADHPVSLRDRHTTIKWRRELKVTMFVFAIALYHSLCWIPLAVLLQQSHELPSSYYTLTHFISYSTTVVNPIIYGAGNRDFRKALANLFGCRNRPTNSPANRVGRETSLVTYGRSSRSGVFQVSGTVQICGLEEINSGTSESQNGPSIDSHIF